jgi:hypothetical protein
MRYGKKCFITATVKIKKRHICNIYFFASFLNKNHIYRNLFASGSSNALNQDLDSRPGLVGNSLDHAGRGVKSSGSASRQLKGVRVRHLADAISEVVASTIGVDYTIEIIISNYFLLLKNSLTLGLAGVADDVSGTSYCSNGGSRFFASSSLH